MVLAQPKRFLPAPAVLISPITATLDAIVPENLGMLQLLRARLLMRDQDASRRNLETQADAALRSWRTLAYVTPVIVAIMVAVALTTGLASPNASFVTIVAPFAVFFALLLWVDYYS